jgi:hypothetical protein
MVMIERQRRRRQATTAPPRAARVRAAALVFPLVACQSAAEPAPPPAPEIAVEEPPSRSAVEPLAEPPAAPVLITDPSQREAAVGKRVTIVGVQSPTKMPQVSGVDVDGVHELSGRRVRVDGILRKRVVEPRETDPDELPVATRGPGTYYSVVDPDTGSLARPRPE